MVSATNADGVGAASSASSPVIPSTTPDAPTAVSALAGNGQATVSWLAAGNEGSEVLSYLVTATDTSNPSNGNQSCTYGVVTPETDTCTVTGLTNGDSYTFVVSATNADGVGAPSSASSPVIPSTTPDAPTAVSALAGNGQATVSFTPGSAEGSPITGYTVTATDTTTSTVISPTTSCTGSPCAVTGLTNGDSYTFVVSATNADGVGAASSASSPVIPSTTPDAPTAVSALAGNGQATVSFTPGSAEGSPITGYTVTATDTTTSTVISPTTSCTGSPCAVTGLTNGDSYTFVVSATNADGVGAPSSASSPVIPSATLITSPAADTVRSGASFSIPLAATAATPPIAGAPPWFSATGLPAGVSLVAGSGIRADKATLTGTAPAPGVYSFTVSVTDPPGAVVSQRFTLTSLGFTSAATSATFTVGVRGSVTLSTSDRAAVISTSSTLPAGLSLVNDGSGAATLAGTPLKGAAEPVDLRIVATDGAVTAVESFSLTIDQAPAIVAARTTKAVVAGDRVFLGLRTTGFPAPTVTLSGAPAWLTASRWGIWGVSPASGGVWTFTVVASNGVGSAATEQVTVRALAFTSAATSATFTVGTPATVTFDTSDPDATLSTSSALPAGLQLVDQGDGTASLEGTPTQGGVRPSEIRITAADGRASVSETFSLTIDQEPTVSASAGVVIVAAGKGVVIDLATSGFPAPSVTLEGAPSWLEVSDREISGTTPSSGGSWTFTVVASNGVGTAATEQVTIRALGFTSPSTASAVHGRPFTFAVSTAGAPPGTTLKATGLTDGLVFTDDGGGQGVITGTPTSSERSALQVTVTATSGSVDVVQKLLISVS